MVFCINKMDLVDHSEARFGELVDEFEGFASKLNGHGRAITYIPMSALNGDNVVERSERMPWYLGPSLIEYLETVEIDLSADQGRPFDAACQALFVKLPMSARRALAKGASRGESKVCESRSSG